MLQSAHLLILSFVFKVLQPILVQRCHFNSVCINGTINNL